MPVGLLRKLTDSHVPIEHLINKLQPSRPPPPPPTQFPSSQRSKSDYIKISDCHSGVPDRSPRPLALKPRTSTSFSNSSTLRPSASNYHIISHQKSRSLSNDHRGSLYTYLDLPPYKFNNDERNNQSPDNGQDHASYVYKEVDIAKTEALFMCKDSRTHNNSMRGVHTLDRKINEKK